MYVQTPPAELQQGDIVLAPIFRAESVTQPPREVVWQRFDKVRLRVDESPILPSYELASGYTVAMVVSHDCQLDKEMNSHATRLRKQNKRLSKAKAEEIAAGDPDLDRFVSVAPIVPMDWLRTDASALQRGNVLGYFPVDEHKTAHIDGGVADLTNICTVDRMLLPARLAALDEDSRARLRLALARLFAFRSPEIGIEVENAIGKRILGIRPVEGSPMEIDLDLQGGATVRLILQPQPVSKGGPSRRAAK